MNKNVIKVFSLIILVTVLLGTVSCSGGSNDVPTLYVYNWGEYISDGSDGTLDVNAEFEKWYLETYGKEVKVNYSTYSSNEDMYAKLSSGAVTYDVVIPSDYMIERMIKEDMLLELNLENIPNAQYIDEKFTGDGAYYDPDGKYSVPYTYGMVGIIYNTKEVAKEDIGSWDLMWNEKYSGNILQFNNSRDAFGTAQYFLGLDVNSADEATWKQAYDKLLAQKPLVQGYVMDEIFNKMSSGSAAVATYYAGDFFTMYSDNNDLGFYYPEEGTNIFVDAMCVPKCTKNKDLAEAYINFMLSEEIAVANAEYICYASPHTLVAQNEEYLETMTEIHPNAIDILYNSAESIPTQYYKNLSEVQLETLNSLWDDLKIESSIGATVYIIAGVIIAILVLIFVRAAMKKSKNKKMWEDVSDK